MLRPGACQRYFAFPGPTPVICDRRMFQRILRLDLITLNDSGAVSGTPSRGSFLTSYTPDRIRHALPIVPFTVRDERSQRIEHLLFTELGNELFKLALHLTGNRRSKLGRNILLSTTPRV